jgi:phospholipid/cholesterol/gamma-HCH transport system substrate-binding protein
MDTKVNFTSIGIFVLLLFFSLLAFVFWLGKYGFEKKQFDTYTIYFTESISGLNVESPIKYQGLEVGRVKHIGINQYNSEEIEVQVQINKGTPIKQDHVALLSTLGITGLKYIELKGGSSQSHLLSANSKGEKVIPSRPSIIESLETSTATIIKELKHLLVQSKKLFNDKNIDSLSTLFEKSASSFENIDYITHALLNQEKQFNTLLNHTINLTQKGSSTFDMLSSSAKSVKDSAQSFQALSKAMKKELYGGNLDIHHITQDSLSHLNNTMQALENSLIQTQNVLQQLQNSPSDLLYKYEKKPLGIGE